MNPITSAIIEWYIQYKRELPWRGLKDPYKIWVSEIILQQTRIEQGSSYYHNFLEKFPTIHSLASAPIDEVMKVWQGLGYYSRARNMHHTANTIVNDSKGEFPSTAVELKKLKGIGDYTSSAIASICFGEKTPAIDGNVKRVIARLFAIQESSDHSAGHRKIKSMADEMINGTDPGEFNQAMMDFGAQQCIPGKPDCYACPLKHMCLGRREPGMYPVKTKKLLRKERYLNYLVILSNDDPPLIIIRKRTGNDIWKQLYDFPCIEKNQDQNFDTLPVDEYLNSIKGITAPEVYHVSDYHRHELTHLIIRARFIYIKAAMDKSVFETTNLLMIKLVDFEDYPIPRLIDRHFKPNHTEF